MTREEFSTLVKGMKAVYTDPKFLPDKNAFDVWYEMLNDLDYKTVSMAIQECIMTERFAPTIADVRNRVNKVSTPVELNEMQAWALVSNALRNGVYGSEKEFNALPPLVQKAVGSAKNLHNWATSDYATVETVISSNFMRSYKAVVMREKEMSQIPVSMRTAIEQNTNKHLMIGETWANLEKVN